MPVRPLRGLGMTVRRPLRGLGMTKMENFVSAVPTHPNATQDGNVVAPDVLGYMDYRKYLKDRLEHLQSTDKKFSQRWVAKRAGFKSPQLLSMIVQGHRNLTRDKAVDLARALKLSDRESEYFGLIVELQDCSSQAEQKALIERIQVSFRHGQFVLISDDGVEIFRDWYYPAIREIVTLKDAQPTPGWIAERLGIPPEAAAVALETLISKGFLRWRGEQLERSEPSVGTRNKVYPMLLGAYHMKMLERAFGAIALGRDQRHFESMTFAIPKRLMPEIKDRIVKFFCEMDMLVEGEMTGREEVCHMRLELFPLTRQISDAK